MKKILLSISIFAFGLTNAQNIFQDNFGTYTTGTQLSGQGSWTNNSSLIGGGGSATAGGFNAKIIASPISYLNYGTANNSYEILINADGCGVGFPATTTGSVYVGLVLNLSATQANSNSDFFRLKSADNANTTCRLYAVNNGTTFNIGIAKGANGNPIAFATGLALNQDHLVIIKYTQNSGTTSDDVAALFIDPVFLSGEPSIPTVSTAAGLDQAGSIDRITFRQNWTNGMPTGKVGLFSVAKGWSSLGFPILATEKIDKNSAFTVLSNEMQNGLLLINSNLELTKTTLNIYNILGSLMETKTISLNQNSNEIIIKPITSTGVYVVELVSENTKFSQKVIVK